MMAKNGPIENIVVGGRSFRVDGDADGPIDLGPFTSGPFTSTPRTRMKLPLFEFIFWELITAPISIPLTIAVFLNMIFRGPIKGFVVLAEKIADFIVKRISPRHE